MGHIGPLGLHMLGKECLGVRLRGKKMSQCTHCAVSKISQQVSRRPPSNQSTRPFHRVYIDWLDLEDGLDSYQGDGAVVRRAMVAVCEATGMAVTYFTQSAKESQNLPHDSEPCQLACKTLQSRRKSDTLGQWDESNQNDRIVQPEWHLFWAMRPRYTRPKRRRRAFRTIDHGKSMSNASVSRPTAQALERNCVYGHLPIQLNPTSVEWLEVPLWGVSQLRFWQGRSLKPTKTASSPPQSIRMQGVCPNKVKKGPPVLPKAPQAWRQSSYWLSCRLRINEYLWNMGAA